VVRVNIIIAPKISGSTIVWRRRDDETLIICACGHCGLHCNHDE
jgi:hypothetical protein